MGQKYVYKDNRSVAFYIIYIFIVQWFLAVSPKQSIYYCLSLFPPQASHVQKHFPSFSMLRFIGKLVFPGDLFEASNKHWKHLNWIWKLSWSLIRDRWANAHNQQKVPPAGGKNGWGGRRRCLGATKNARYYHKFTDRSILWFSDFIYTNRSERSHYKFHVLWDCFSPLWLDQLVVSQRPQPLNLFLLMDSQINQKEECLYFFGILAHHP